MTIHSARMTTGPDCAVAHFDHLVITVSRGSDGYDILVEVDTDEDAATVGISIGTATETVWDGEL